MEDGDWADAAAWVKTTNRSPNPPLSTKDLTQLTPLDQYQAISKGFDGVADALYATDVLEQHLSETGRLAFVDWCLQNDSVARADGDVSKWAVCWPDVEKIDAAKIFAEIRADHAHDGVAKMSPALPRARTARHHEGGRRSEGRADQEGRRLPEGVRRRGQGARRMGQGCRRQRQADEPGPDHGRRRLLSPRASCWPAARPRPRRRWPRPSRPFRPSPSSACTTIARCRRRDSPSRRRRC